MFYIVIGGWTVMFLLMVVYMYKDLKIEKRITEWQSHTTIEVKANRERITELEKKVKHLESETECNDNAITYLSDCVADLKEHKCNCQNS